MKVFYNREETKLIFNQLHGLYSLLNNTQNSSEKEKLIKEIEIIEYKIIEDHEGLIYPYYKIDFDLKEAFDQEGRLGLLEAIKGFDNNKNVQFSTYAFIYVKKNIYKFLKEYYGKVHISSNMKELYLKYNRFINDYYDEFRKYPSDSKIIEELKINQTKLDKLKEIRNLKVSSLDQSISNDDDTSFHKMIADQSSSEAYNEIIDKDSDENLVKLLEIFLKPRELKICLSLILKTENTSLSELKNELGISKQRIFQIRDDIILKLKKLLLKYQTDDLFNALYSHLKQLPSLNNNPDLGFNYETIMMMFNDFTLDKFKNKFGKKYETLTDKEKECIHMFFNNLEISTPLPQLSSIEMKVNNRYFRTQMTVNTMSKDNLKKVYLKYQDQFTEVQIDLINHFLMSELSREDLLKKYSNKNYSYFRNQYYKLLIKLEKLFFNIATKEFDLDEISYILKQDKQVFSSLEKVLLDLSYFQGLNYKEIAEYLFKMLNDKSLGGYNNWENEVYEIFLAGNDKRSFEYSKKSALKIHDRIMNSKDKLNLLLNNVKGHKNYSEFSFVKKYIENDVYPLDKKAKKALQLKVFENKENSYIADELKVSLSKVHTLLTMGLLYINYYYYLVMPQLVQSDDDLKKFLSISEYSSKDQEIVISKYMHHKSNDEIKKLYNVTRDYYDKLFYKFNKDYLNFRFSNAKGFPSLTKEDLEKELSLHITDRIVTSKEEQIISLTYGIKSEYNVDGKVYSKTEIFKLLKITPRKYQEYSERLEMKLLNKKYGVVYPDYGIISREKLMKIIVDPNLPLDEEEIKLVKMIKEIDTKYHSVSEISKIFKTKEQYIKVKYLKAMLKIEQYLAGDLEAKYHYEVDIVSNLKYFPDFERKIIELKYKKNMSLVDIAKKLNLSYAVIVNASKDIEVYLKQLINDKKTYKFDFDYAKSVLKQDDLLLYGYKDFKIQAFCMYHGILGYSKMSVPDIIRKLNSEYSEAVVHRFIDEVTIAVLKYRLNIKKYLAFTKSDILNYIEHANPSASDLIQLKEALLMDKTFLTKSFKLPNHLKYKIKALKYKKRIDLANASKVEVINFLKTDGANLRIDEKIKLANTFSISLKELLTNKDYKILFSIFKSVLVKKSEETYNL